MEAGVRLRLAAEGRTAAHKSPRTQACCQRQPSGLQLVRLLWLREAARDGAPRERGLCREMGAGLLPHSLVPRLRGKSPSQGAPESGRKAELELLITVSANHTTVHRLGLS